MNRELEDVMVIFTIISEFNTFSNLFSGVYADQYLAYVWIKIHNG